MMVLGSSTSIDDCRQSVSLSVCLVLPRDVGNPDSRQNANEFGILIILTTTTTTTTTKQVNELQTWLIASPKINGNFMLSLRKNQHGPKSARTKHKVNATINDLN
ncbi:hypothetical protein ACLKA7_007336 [Drosophila subpalustris]